MDAVVQHLDWKNKISWISDNIVHRRLAVITSTAGVCVCVCVVVLHFHIHSAAKKNFFKLGNFRLGEPSCKTFMYTETNTETICYLFDCLCVFPGLAKLCTLGFLFIGQLIDFLLIALQVVGPSDLSEYYIPFYGPILNRTALE